MVVRKEVCLTQSEWYVMDCLWAYAPQTVMQLATDLSQRAGWAKSTTITTLEQMEAKGLVRSTPVGRDTQYHPCVRREEAGGLLLPGLYLSGECGADGVRHGGW